MVMSLSVTVSDKITMKIDGGGVSLLVNRHRSVIFGPIQVLEAQTHLGFDFSHDVVCGYTTGELWRLLTLLVFNRHRIQSQTVVGFDYK